jgi:hypothetical protein
MMRVEERIKKKFNEKTGKWEYDMPDGGRRIADETITHNSSLYGVLAVEHFIIADVPKVEEEPEEVEEEEKPVPKKPGRPKNREED